MAEGGLGGKGREERKEIEGKRNKQAKEHGRERRWNKKEKSNHLPSLADVARG